jgi:EAL domain-containing protein (putative c-di-GMP-specific phosphodiesterase class I)
MTIKALEEENIDIFIHKMFNENKNTIGGEILARIKGEEGEYIPAFIFIPLIERKNLMPKLDRIILKKVIKNILRGCLTHIAYDSCISALSAKLLATMCFAKYLAM